MKNLFVLMLFCFACVSCIFQQQTIPIMPTGRDSMADPDFLEQYAATYRFRLGRPTNIKITPNGSQVLFLRFGPRSFERNLYAFDTQTGQERILLTAQQVLGGTEEQLTAEEKAQRERKRIGAFRGIASYTLSKDGQTLLVPLSGRLFVVDIKNGKSHEIHSKAGYPLNPSLSPDGKKLACVRNNDLFVTDLVSGIETRLTHSGGPTSQNGLAEFIAQEEMNRHQGYWWSPDSQHIVYQHNQIEQVEQLHIIDLKSPNLPPKAWRYPRAGKKNAVVRLGIIPASGGSTTWVQWDNQLHPYLARLCWKPGGPLSILVQNRTQTKEQLLIINPQNGSIKLLHTETDSAWLNLFDKIPYWLSDGSFLWVSERVGREQLELRQADGKLVRSLLPENLVFISLLAVDLHRQTAFIEGARIATQRHVWAIDLNGKSPPQALTKQPGFHSAVFSEDGSIAVYQLHTKAGRKMELVKRRDGSLIGQLKSLSENPPFQVQAEFTWVGQRQYNCALIRPRNFETGRKYPVIVYVYAGPNSQTVMQAAQYYLVYQWMADHGFIVVTIDGRGTLGRGRDWQRAIKGNFIRVPLEDQVDALQALGKKYSELDLDRVGVYGWSFGGYFATMAVMQRPDVFHAGVAGAPVADWEDYDTHYTERFMGLPQDNPQGYKDANVITHAPRLENPLLLIHGTMDDNVYFAHSIKISDALFRAGKDHDFLPLSGSTHGFSDPLVAKRLYTRVIEFFSKHLGVR